MLRKGERTLMKKETIYLAGGCFWGTEKYMQSVAGVLETRVGYALGEKPLWNPPLKESVTYEEVSITADTPKRSRLSLMRKKSL